MIFAVESVSHIAKSDSSSHVLKFAIAIGRTGQAVKWMIRYIEFHDVASQLRNLRCLCPDFHALFDGRGAGSRIALSTFHFYNAQSARTECLEAVGCAQLRDIDAEVACRAQN